MSDELPVGDIQFYDNIQPGLGAATYQITVAQELEAPDASVDSVTQNFLVEGPRFALLPSDIHTVFPPAGVMGQFEETLPFVVLNKRALPWEREIPGLPPATPWLALLVFEQGELSGPAYGGSYAQTLTVAQLLAPDSPPGQVLKPQLSEVTSLQQQMSCQAITIPSELFSQIVPTAAELPFLAHVRRLNTGDKTTGVAASDGWFSVVVANRFPQPGTATDGAQAIVHLVSLEGFGSYIGGTTPAQPAEPYVQLVSLANWTFSCLADPAQNFAELAANLALDDAGRPRPADSLMLRLPLAPPVNSPPASSPPTELTDGAEATAWQRLSDGYVALGYHTQTGEDGFAWFRGPLAPVIPNPLSQTGPFQTSAAAMIYDETTGVFDHSLAAAWQAGRNLALSDQSFAVALMSLRQGAGNLLDQIAQQGGDPAAPAPRDLVDAQLAALFGGGLSETIRRASTTGRLPRPARAAPDDAAHLSSPPSSSLPSTSLPASPSPSLINTLRNLVTRPEVRAAIESQLDADSNRDAVVQWLGALCLLYGVPFIHLVPDARMLPQESIRFFYLDENWTDALADGALSIGIGSSRDAAIQLALAAPLRSRAAAAARSHRARRRDSSRTARRDSSCATRRADPAPSPTSGPFGGVLIRSALVSGWPGLAVRAAAAGRPLSLLRMDTLGPNVLLCLFDGVPGTLTIAEPQEGVEFGVNAGSPPYGQIELRRLTSPVGAADGALTIYDLQSPAEPMPTLRDGGLRVLNINTGGDDLLGAIAAALGVGRDTLGPADFALQMVKAPEQVKFSGS